ncbi:catechol O-methyltransferase [Talaromyces islandicus]|uniref:catechol O-methyltransferase n=1 Tax=Talaromyces islandicus TaxID=28573 RepID=A0A0U1LUH2_TALIS|nr:catechol O-methyltransferase [Talaromyces islandicus]
MSPRRSAPPFVPKPLSWCLDGRETGLLHYVFSRPDLEDLRGSPSKVLQAIDDYSEQYKYLMNIGSTKGKCICDLIAANKPSVIIELGGYVGYSAILFADAMRANGGKQYLSLEVNPEMAAVSSVLVELAGLRELVRTMIGPSDESLVRLIRVEKKISTADMVFIDHWQELYLPDLRLLEQLNVLKPGVSRLVADNMMLSGSMDYQQWLRATPAKKREMNKKTIEDFEKSRLKRKQPSSASGHQPRLGNPNLIYETMTKIFDLGSYQDGVEITKVIGEEDKA